VVKEGDIIPNGNLVKDVGLVVTMSAAGGSSSAPAIAGLGFDWSRFKTEIVIITAATEKSVGLKIRLKNSAADEVKGTFNLIELGWKDECSVIATESSKIARANSAKAFLTDRTLSFSGIRGDSRVEIMNLQGQVMQKGTTAAAMDLSRLDAGVYMVRIAGSMNLAQKILLK